tara:strand:+ start:50 stop:484 length:435 start_codon:yes stop_codon:yes gene_type:complete
MKYSEMKQRRMDRNGERLCGNCGSIVEERTGCGQIQYVNEPWMDEEDDTILPSRFYCMGDCGEIKESGIKMLSSLPSEAMVGCLVVLEDGQTVLIKERIVVDNGMNGDEEIGYYVATPLGASLQDKGMEVCLYDIDEVVPVVND